jgi:tRNA uridine 5-carboxymethylaminomethyl modification enzyme
MQQILNNYPGLDIRAGSAFDLVFDHSEPSSNLWGKISGVLLGEFQVLGGNFTYL